jgi:hypothetical protein
MPDQDSREAKPELEPESESASVDGARRNRTDGTTALHTGDHVLIRRTLRIMRPGYGSRGPSKVYRPPKPRSGLEDLAWTREEWLAQSRRRFKRRVGASLNYVRDPRRRPPFPSCLGSLSPPAARTRRTPRPRPGCRQCDGGCSDHQGGHRHEP